MSVFPVAGVTPVVPSYAPNLHGTDAVNPSMPFASVAAGIDSLQQAQSNSKSLAIAAMTGDLDDVHDYTIAAAQSATQLELTAAVRNKAVEAFQEIMRMTV
jgi:flagellar hook-basal body complex protein FliE